MFNTRRVVSEIRSAVQRDNQALTETLRQLSDDYLDACRSANARLRFCGEYLARGLRGEAIQLAEAAPPLLDEVSLLDFPELEKWREICDDYGLPYESLLMDVTDEINKAYEGFEDLDRLLHNYRLSNLMESPLNQRLAHLRKLAVADPDAEHWFADLAEFEAVRLREMETALKRSVRRSALEPLLCLLEEVRMETWTTPVPNKLVQAIDRAVEETRALQPEGKQHRDHLLARITNALESAIRSGNVSRSRTLARRWQEVAGRSRLPSDAPTRSRGRQLLSELREPAVTEPSV